MVQTNFTVDIAFEELTKELDIAIGREVAKFNNKLTQKGRDVWDTGHFFRSFKDPVKTGTYDWRITNTAEYAPILARGRRPLGDKMAGSEKWSGGLNPMLAKLEADIIKETDKIKV